jgi:Leucine-rich repeat (LRR) protein
MPHELGDCAKLERLHLMGNVLGELPESMGRLGRLRELWLGQNPNISALPETFYQLSSLKALNMEMFVFLVSNIL